VAQGESRAAGQEIDLSVVVPVLDEQDCLPLLWEALAPALAGLDRSWEVVFVDDGSTDASLDRLREIHTRHPGVRVIRLDGHHGQSAALDAGFRAARGRWVATLDADLQNPPREIGRLLAAADGVDLVFGRRRERRDGTLKRLTSAIGNAVRNAITGHHVRDIGCSLKLYRRAALRGIPAFAGMHRFLPTLFVIHGFRVREIDVEHERRAAGRSKYGIRGRALRGLVDCCAVRWMRSRRLSYEASELPREL